MAVSMPVPPLLLAGRLSAEDSGHAQGASLGAIGTKTGIPKTSLHRYLTDTDAVADPR
jgi:hypothetical protein